MKNSRIHTNLTQKLLQIAGLLTLTVVSYSVQANSLRFQANQGMIIGGVTVVQATKDLNTHRTLCFTPTPDKCACAAMLLDVTQIGIGVLAVAANLKARDSANNERSVEELETPTLENLDLSNLCGGQVHETCFKQKVMEARRLMDKTLELLASNDIEIPNVEDLKNEIRNTQAALGKLPAGWSPPDSNTDLAQDIEAPQLALDAQKSDIAATEDKAEDKEEQGEEGIATAEEVHKFYEPTLYAAQAWTQAQWAPQGVSSSSLGLFERCTRRHQGLIGERNLGRAALMARMETIRQAAQQQITVAKSQAQELIASN